MNDFLKMIEGWEGFNPVGSSRISEAALAKFVDLFTNAQGMPAHRQEYLIRESVTTSDFPYLFGQVLDRSMLARYRAAASPWRSYVKTGKLRDFRAATLHKLVGSDGLLAVVPEKTEYPGTSQSTGYYSHQLYKRGRSFDISWESLINDAMDAFGDIPQRFADAALNTEAILATGIYAITGGPNTALFGATISDVDGQAITNKGTLALTMANLEATLALMTAQTDLTGNPLSIRASHLVVPPALEMTARTILTSALKVYVDTVGGANASTPAYVPMPTNSIIPQMGLQLHIDPWLPIVDTSAGKNKTWYLFSDQGNWGQVDFLTGHESPEICMKASNKVAVGGGPINQFEGDFDSDNVLYRVRHVLGATPFDPRYAYAQVGT